MIITIDGPAGAGKSTVARALARRLGFHFLDTGASYRAVALAGLRRGIDWKQPDELARLAASLDIRLDGPRVSLDGEDVSDSIRSSEVTAVTRFAADNPDVRRLLVDLQRRAAEGRDVVTEGRDQGSVVFPDAECKIFLTASPEARAARRVQDFLAQGESPSPGAVLADINRRDQEDAARPVGPLVQPADAIEVSTDGLSVAEVVDRLAAIVRERMSASVDSLPEHITTAEQLLAATELGPCELVQGKLIMLSLSGAEHGWIAANIAGVIGAFADEHALGPVFAGGTGFHVAHDPDTVRAPDVAFVRAERVGETLGRGFFQGPPDLAVEVLSPDDRASEVRAKVQMWLDSGTTAVWVVDPRTRSVSIHHGQSEIKMLRASDTLSGGDLLPGFNLPVGEIFGA